MEFRPISIGDKADVERLFSLFPDRGCEFSFASSFCWRDIYPADICRVDGLVLLRVKLDHEHMVYMFPFGVEEYSPLLPLIEKDAEANGTTPIFYIGNTSLEPMLRTLYPSYGAFYERAYSDYIYSREKLASLKGSHLQAKRNFVNKFNSLYSWEYRPLEKADGEECLELLSLWTKYKRSEENVSSDYLAEMDAERQSIIQAFGYFDELGITGGTIRIDGRIVAFCYGTPISDDTFCVHIEKVDEMHTGLYQVINQQFVLHLPPEYRFINRENDLGIHGLRKAKESYHPVRIMNKYCFARMSDVMLQVRDLWLRSFPEDSEKDAEQYLLTRFNEGNLVAEYDCGRMIAMLHIISFGESAYFYAIATDPEYRHRGIGRRIVGQAIRRCREEGYHEAVLIPSGDMSRAWYETMGFSGRYRILFNTEDEFDFCSRYDEYDYGTGDRDADLAMTLPLTDKCPTRTEEGVITLSDREGI